MARRSQGENRRESFTVLVDNNRLLDWYASPGDTRLINFRMR
jgi:hypothetical protein